MRILRHDVRDLSLAFGLAFDLRRVTQAGTALCWTMIVAMGVVGILSWRITGGAPFAPEGIIGAWDALVATAWTPSKALAWSCVLGAWWAGFAYLCAPVQRSAAMDIARDERDRNPNIPVLNRQSAFGPLVMLLFPAAMFVVVLIWSLLTLIPGSTGGVISAVTLPLALIAAVAGAAFFVVGVLAAPMMGPTAVVEGRDYLEVVSRPMSYVMQRPGRYFAYWAAKLGVLAACTLAGVAVLAVSWGFVGLALWVIGQGATAQAAFGYAVGGGEFSEAPAAFGIAVVAWGSGFVLIAWLMVISLSTDLLIYMLMRYQIDGVTFDKVMVAEEHVDPLKSAVETAEEAESARKRFDEAQEPAVEDAPQTA
ncbi:MAG: hypothetical protein H6839_12265 [Planctomycetes bacterium]|nr:hypothetical protein [Planctomycetota bacterium]